MLPSSRQKPSILALRILIKPLGQGDKIQRGAIYNNHNHNRNRNHNKNNNNQKQLQVFILYHPLGNLEPSNKFDSSAWLVFGTKHPS